jgi:hypothetical protein
MRRKAQTKENNVNFRLDDLAFDKLLNNAQQFNTSHHLYARECLVQVLNEPVERAELTRRVAAQEAALMELRVDLALAVEALLIASGNYSEQQAGEWVRSQLHPS